MAIQRPATSQGSGQLTSLRLAHCPQCDYSLEGLPDEGICPECGRHYDQSIIILPCRSAREAGASGALSVIAISAMVLAWLVIPWDRGERIYVGFCALGALLQIAVLRIERATSRRTFVWLLWIGSDGIAVQRDFDSGSIFAWTRRTLPALPLLAIAFLHRGSTGLILLVCMVPFLLGMNLLAHLRSRRKFVAGVQRATPDLVPWSKVPWIRFDEKRGGRWHLRAQNSAWVQNSFSVDVVIDCDSQLASELRERLQLWSGNEDLARH